MAATASAATVLLAFAVAGAGAVSRAGALLVLALGLGLYARHWLSLAERSRVGARSEDEIRRTLAPLEAEGWRLRHSLPWRERGDIDLIAITPSCVAFAIEVKTSRYEDRHLILAREQATWLSRFRRRWCPHGVVPVLCVARARGVHRWEQGVLVVSIDCLLPALLAAGSPIQRVALPFLNRAFEIARGLGEDPYGEQTG
jgi:Holliday junction resolvase-like predicted endonuclease